MIVSDLAYAAPKSVEEAIGLLLEWNGQGRALAGGMSLLPAMNLGFERPRAIVSLSRLRELEEISLEPDGLHLGARVTHRTLAADPAVAAFAPVIARTAGGLADVQVRNRGTLGGSLANAHPGADAATTFCALDASVIIRGIAGTRRLALEQLILGRGRTSLAPEELIVAVVVPALPIGYRAGYIRYSRIQGNYSTVNAAAVLTQERTRIAIGGATPRPVVLQLPPLEGTSGELELSDVAARASAACVEVYDDHMASADYRRAMAGVLARRVVELALSQAPAGGKETV